MANYPTSLDSMTNPSSSTYMDDSGFELDVLISRLQDIAEALEAKVGIAASTPVSGTVLRASGTGSSTWAAVTAADLSAGAAMVKIAEVTASGSSGVMEITSITASFRDLIITVVGRSQNAGSAGTAASLTFESSPTAGAYNHVLGIITTSLSATENIGATDSIQVGAVPTAGSTANVHGGMHIVVHEYANTGMFKPVEAICSSPLTLSAGSFQLRVVAGVFESTSAITRVRLTIGSNWTTTSRMTIFGTPV